MPTSAETSVPVDIRQGFELALAVDQDRDQDLAVLGEQDASSPFLGAPPDPEREADRPIARDNAAVDPAVLEEAFEALPVVETVTDRNGDRRFGGGASELRLQPSL